MDVLVATLKDYAEDLDVMMHDFCYVKAVAAMQRRAIAEYLSVLFDVALEVLANSEAVKVSVAKKRGKEALTKTPPGQLSSKLFGSLEHEGSVPEQKDEPPAASRSRKSHARRKTRSRIQVVDPATQRAGRQARSKFKVLGGKMQDWLHGKAVLRVVDVRIKARLRHHPQLIAGRFDGRRS